MGIYELYSKERKPYFWKRRLFCSFLFGGLGVIGLFCLQVCTIHSTVNSEIAPFAFFRTGEKLPLNGILSDDARTPKLLRSKTGDASYYYQENDEDKYRVFTITGNISRLKNIFRAEDGQRCTVGSKESLFSEDGIQAVLTPAQDDSTAILTIVAPKTKQYY